MAAKFELASKFQPAGDQPKAIAKLVEGFRDGRPCQTLLGATGTGKTFTAANVIAQLGKPTLVLAHNKTLAAQLYKEFRGFFPRNAVHYFVSYYDYYQPEAYIPQRDIYIEKDALDQREHRPPPPGRHQRPGQPRGRHHRRQRLVHLRPGLAQRLQAHDDLPAQRARSSTATSCCCDWSTSSTSATTSPSRAASSACAATWSRSGRRPRSSACASSCSATRSTRWRIINPTSGETLRQLDELYIYPAKHFVTPEERIKAGGRGHRQGAGRAAGGVPPGGQAAGGAAAGGPHALRHGDAAGGRPLPRHRELRPLVQRPQARRAALHAASTSSPKIS